jgi:hypothetical protein
VLVAARARARTPETARWLRPGQLELHVEGGLSLLAPSLEAGAGGEVGVLAVGPGTLSLGTQLDLRQCLLACSLSGLLAGQSVSTRDVSVLGRLGYHVRLEGPGRGPVDVYGVLLGGVMEARTFQVSPEAHVEGRGRGPAFGLGLGGHAFLSEHFFLGGEARLRFASGVYALSVTQGAHVFTEEETHWLRLGPETVLFVGVRL